MGKPRKPNVVAVARRLGFKPELSAQDINDLANSLNFYWMCPLTKAGYPAPLTFIVVWPGNEWGPRLEDRRELTQCQCFTMRYLPQHSAPYVIDVWDGGGSWGYDTLEEALTAGLNELG